MELDEIFKDREVRKLAKYAAEGNIQKIDELVKSGVDVNARGALNATPLFVAIGNIDGFRRLLELGANPNVKFDDKGTVLHWLARLDAAEQMQIVLKHGGDPNLTAGNFDHTPAFKSIRSSNQSAIPKTLKLLLDYGASVDQVDDINSSLLIESASAARFDITLFLLSKGADPNIKPTRGMDFYEVVEWRKGLLKNNKRQTEYLMKVEQWLKENK